jgi:hypothetical protein
MPKHIDAPEAEEVVVSCFEAHCLTPAQTTAFWDDMSKWDWGQTCNAGNTNLEFHYQNGTIVPVTVKPKPSHVSKNCKRANSNVPDQTAANAAELQTVMEAFANPELTNTMIIFSFIDADGTSHLFPVNLQVAPRDKSSNSKRHTEAVAGAQNENLLVVPGMAPPRKYRPSRFGTPTARVSKASATSSFKVSSSRVGNIVSLVFEDVVATDSATSTASPSSGAPTSVATISKPAATSTVEVKTLVNFATRKHSTYNSITAAAAPAMSNKPAVPWFCDPAGRAKVAMLGLSSPSDWEKKCAGYQLPYIVREAEVAA